MSWLRQRIGLDWFDLLIQVGVTGMLMTLIKVSHGPAPMFPVIVGASLVVLSVRRSIALRRFGQTGLTTGEMAAERIAELEQRVAELEAAQAQVAELNERLDFAERLLAASPGSAAARLPHAGEE